MKTLNSKDYLLKPKDQIKLFEYNEYFIFFSELFKKKNYLTLF